MNAEQQEILAASIERAAHDLQKLHEYVCKATESDFSSVAIDLRAMLAQASTMARQSIPFLRNVGDK